LAHRFVKDPAEVAKVGDRVKVKVIKIDAERRRIGLSVKQASAPPQNTAPPQRNAAPQKNSPPPPGPRKPDPAKPKKPEPFNNPFAAAFKKG
jgi:uncharacterized protein